MAICFPSGVDRARTLVSGFAGLVSPFPGIAREVTDVPLDKDVMLPAGMDTRRENQALEKKEEKGERAVIRRGNRTRSWDRMVVIG